VDVSGIQEYVLGPSQLKLRRGASLLVRDFNEEISRRPGAIFSNGGNALVVFAPASEADDFRREIAARFQEMTAIGVVRTAQAEYERNRFKASWEALQDAMASEKARPLGRFFTGSNPYWGTCKCGQYPAVERRRLYEEEEESYFCRACVLRLERNPSRDDDKLPRDFNDLGSVADPRGYLALVAIDFDGMGSYFSEHATESEELCGEVSTRIDESLRTAIDSACKRIEKREILLSGGDDCAVMIPAHNVFDFLSGFRDAFRREFLREFRHTREAPPLPSFSAGVTIAHSHFPISEFFRVAKELQASAKGVRKRELKRGGTPDDSVDYEIISTSMSDRPVRSRQQIADRGHGYFRTAKPYLLEQFLALRKTVEDLKSTAPANKIKRLYRIAYESPLQSDLDYLRVREGLDARSRQTVLETIGASLWREKEDGKTVTNAADIAELWEFVP
jgi:hypothetical protein